ncbi:MAG: YifB family Mg chelatase-like AAA ATPase [Nitriliruptorales bacterium]
MVATVGAIALIGVDARPVRVECDTGRGLPQLRLVGLPDTALREAGERVRSAVRRSDFEWPPEKVVVNLAPAGLPKAGAGFDLPIAIGVLASSGQVPPAAVRDLYAFGELGLDGRVRSVPGTLPAAAAAARYGGRRFFVADRSAVEASLVDGVEIVPVRDLAEAASILRGESRARPPLHPVTTETDDGPDLSDVRGQSVGRRALEIAAAGGHHVLFVGPPGCGKSLLAARLPSILPRLSFEAALEVAAIHSVVGIRQPDAALSFRPPFRAPHHTISIAGLVGGGPGIPRPGELSSAHRGVLFIDELLEVPRHVLDALRQPMESGEVTIVRSKATVTFPAEVQLVAAANPCPCGYLGHPKKSCGCHPNDIDRYRRRLSGPLLDRIDLAVELAPVEASALLGAPTGESSAEVFSRVQAARSTAIERWGPTTARTVPIQIVRDTCEAEALTRLADHVDRLGLSVRSFDRAVRVARTIADLDGASGVTTDHVDEALAYRLAEPAHVA